MIPYDYPWTFDDHFLKDLNEHRALRLLGKFVGKNPERLAELTHVEYLAVSRYPKFGFEILEGFRALNVLELDFLQLMTLDGIENLQLRMLGMTELRRLESIDALRRLPLLVLRIALCNRVSDYSPIEDLRHLVRCDLEAKELTSLGFLKGLKGLQRLGLAVDKIHSNVINDLAGLPQLRRIGIRRRLLGRTGLKRLQEALPATTIEAW